MVGRRLDLCNNAGLGVAGYVNNVELGAWHFDDEHDNGAVVNEVAVEMKEATNTVSGPPCNRRTRRYI